jgi:magnesium transporter
MRIDTSKRLSKEELETSIGMYTDPYPYSFRLDQSVEELLFSLQTEKRVKRPEYFYITDEKNTLIGFITLTDLLYNSPDTLLHELVDTEVLKVYGDEPLEKGLHFLSHHQLLVVPVVNRESRLLGILEINPNGNQLHKTKKIHHKYLKEDVFQFIGFSIEHRKWNAPFAAYRLRMPWLLCNLVGGLVCALISKFYRLTLEQFVILAFFIPLVLSLSESISIQSMTLSLRFLRQRKLHWGQVWKRSFVETKSSLMIGITSAILVSCFYFVWNVEFRPILGIGISVILAMMASALFGALFPIFLHVLRLDPKVAAGPVVLMVADILTIAIYLTLNTFILF